MYIAVIKQLEEYQILNKSNYIMLALSMMVRWAHKNYTVLIVIYSLIRTDRYIYYEGMEREGGRRREWDARGAGWSG